MLEHRRRATEPLTIHRRRLVAFAILLVVALSAPARVEAAETCGGRLGDPIRLLDPGDDDSGIGGTGVTPATGEADRAHGEPPRPPRGGDDDDSGIGGTGHLPDESGIGGTGHLPDESGIGGTGHLPDESGIGGTGHLPDESGIGGTGHIPDESGIGGTGHTSRGVGLFGRTESIEGAGRGRGTRVCVGGLEVSIPESLALEASGGAEGAAVSRSLATGQLVFIEAVRTADGLMARRLVLAAEGAGRIDGQAEDGTWLVNGSKLRIGPATVRDPSLRDADLAPGRWIVFQSQLGPDGELFVTRVGRGREGRSHAPGTTLETELPERLLEAKRSGRIDYASIEGILGEGEGRPRVGRLELALPAAVPDAMRRALRPGARVRVGGRIERDGALQVMPPRPFAPRPPTLAPPPSDRPQRPEATPERPPRPSPDDVRPPARPVRPQAPREAARPSVRPVRPGVDRRLSR